jgi:cellulose synthase/poly-beta-1,6-N-acetylglucosamine synthase-like glycosyltransferase
VSGPAPMPRCSVVLPTYNRMRTLPRAVASVLALDESDFELIVVDDASTDGTEAWLREQTDPRLRVLRSRRNGGPSAARNLGIDAARSPVVAFLDSDDVYRPNRLSVPLRALAEDAEIVCTLSSAMKTDPKRIRTIEQPEIKLAPAAFEWALTCDLIGVEGTSITVRTDAVRAAGGFCTALRRTEDREFLIRLAQFGGLRVLSDVLWEKGWSTDSLSNAWSTAGRDLVSYVAQRPEYVDRFRKLGSYQATKILVADLKRIDLPAFFGDVRRFRAAGLLPGGLARLWRNHREVKRYRKAMSGREALMSLTGPPGSWT